ncbi:MAG: 50S ribosomal protein L4 [Candidatus Marinimicrobia bacterium]|nr:50S ribosomal protein L4 [Candidatus Neomarinimicrobiota bacterium]|tara:strand:+ start:2018 stop:2647 length:630 start_codon:yes stop_codon:yes gene_type:complete
MKVNIYSKEGKKTSAKVDMDNRVFKIDPNEHCIYLAVKSELAAKRQGTSSSKTRSEVRGGGRKPYKQKGTGNARVGSTRNPARVHGGSAFGPKPRKYELKLNKKVKTLARKSALSMKVIADSFKVLNDFSMDSVKTKDLHNILRKLDVNDKKILIIANNIDNNFLLSSRNLKNVNLVNVDSFSTYDIINSSYLLFDKNSVDCLNKKLMK